MKLVNESTGYLFAGFYDSSGNYLGCGWIDPGGKPWEMPNATEVRVEVGGNKAYKDDGRIVYKGVPKDGVVIVGSAVEGGHG